MAGHDERFVQEGLDAWVEESWLDFRMRLAEWMLAAPDDNTLVVDPAPHDLTAPTLQVSTNDDARFVALVFADDDETALQPPFALSFRTASLLTDLEFVPAQPDGNPVLGLDRDEVDRLAHAAATVLRDVWGVVSPAFLSVEVFSPGDDAEILAWDDAEPIEPEQEAEPAPEIGRAGSREELQALVEAMMQEIVTAPLKVAPGGRIHMRGQGGPVTVRVRDTSLVEVVTVLAREVRFKRAHREADRLSRRFRHVRFFLERDVLLAVVPVPASPLVAEHLHDAVNHLLRLRTILSGLDERLKRRRATVPSPVPPADADLTALAGAATRMRATDLVEALRRAAGDLATVERWIAVARHERATALAAGRDADETLRSAHLRQWRRWRRVHSALAVVREELGSGHRRKEAS